MSSSNQRTRSSGGRGVDAEVQKLFRKSNGKMTSADFLALRKNYGDVNSVDAIQKAFMEKYSYVVKKAKKFARLVREKYSDGTYPYHILLQKAHKYKKKYSMVMMNLLHSKESTNKNYPVHHHNTNLVLLPTWVKFLVTSD